MSDVNMDPVFVGKVDKKRMKQWVKASKENSLSTQPGAIFLNTHTVNDLRRWKKESI